MGDLIKIYPPAKVNFSLEVVGKRPDGYHNLKMLMAPVSLYDCLTVEFLPASHEISVISSGSPHVGSGDKNICHRAARFFLEETKTAGGVRISVEKNIPVGAGMGGGSSDAAAVIMALEELCGKALSPEAKARSAFKVGADLPFFFARGWAWAEGVGEIVTPVKEESPVWLTVIDPGVFLSTASVFSDHTNMLTCGALLPNISQFNFRGVAKGLRNDLQAAALRISPEVGKALALLGESGAEHFIMTGSGSAVFALFDKMEEATRVRDKAAKSAPPSWRTLVVRTLGEVDLARPLITI